jgi:hypothetical protein
MNMRNPPHEVIVSRSMRVPPSPREQPLPLNRSHSEGIPLASSSFQSDGPLKRSFWHHAKSGDEYQNSLPNEFMPPKRSKVAMDGRRDYVVTASRTFSEDMHDSMHSPERNVRSAPRPQPPAGWFNRGMFGETRDDYYHRKSGGGELYSGSWTRSPPYREGGPLYREGGTAPHWSDAPFMPSPRVRYPPGDGGRYDIPSQGHVGIKKNHVGEVHRSETMWRLCTLALKCNKESRMTIFGVQIPSSQDPIANHQCDLSMDLQCQPMQQWISLLLLCLIVS